MASSLGQYSEFGPFRLDRAGRILLRNGEAVALAPKTFDVLALLVENPGRAISKAEILAALWPETAVEEGNLAFQISTLRKALGAEGSKWVETVPRHGYRFRAPEVTPEVTEFTPPAKAKKRQWLWIAAGVVALTVIAGVSMLIFRSGQGDRAISIPLTTYPGIEASPSFAPNGKDVMFVWDNGQPGRWGIYVKLAGVEAPVRITSAPEGDLSPAWSPDGRMIAFVRRLPAGGGRQYFIKPYPDGPERLLMVQRNCLSANPNGQTKLLAWHPNGGHLIISAAAEGRVCGLVALSIVTGATSQLTEPPLPSQRDAAPAVSPDGRTLAFVRGVGFHDDALHAISLSQDLKPAGQPWRVTSDTNRMEIGPAWMPDSRELVYSSGSSIVDFTLFRVVASGGGKPRPVSGAGPLAFGPSVSSQGSIVYSAAGPGKTSLWRVELPRHAGGEPVLNAVAPSSHAQQMPVFSPSGERIAFESERSGQHELWTAGVNGNPVQRLTSLEAIAQGPEWSPDGMRVLFSTSVQRQREIYVIGADGGTPRRLTEDPSDDASPHWSQDGRWIYFHSNRSGGFEVWRMPADGGPASRITQNGGMIPRESRDRRFIYYQKRAGQRASLWRLPVGGGPETLVLDGCSPLSHFVAMEDGIYFVSAATPEEANSQIRFHDFASGESRDVVAIPGPLGWGLSVSRDRRTFLVTRVQAESADLRLIPKL